jgi:uncharacterized protein Yka (UPF0111/DUF47 family)
MSENSEKKIADLQKAIDFLIQRAEIHEKNEEDNRNALEKRIANLECFCDKLYDTLHEYFVQDDNEEVLQEIEEAWKLLEL